MRSSDYRLGYCTNVHSAADMKDVKSNLSEYALAVKKIFSPNAEMGLGLWLSNDACGQLVASNQLAEFSTWMKRKLLVPFTFNGFPFGDFHQPSVKHKVYQPTWAEESRLQYTMAIAKIQARLLEPGSFGTISTLPLGWAKVNAGDGFLKHCASQLLRCADALAELKENTGQHICVCLEPEPGCVLDTSDKLVRYFQEYLLAGADSRENVVRSHLGVCHDICHSAVMFESQQTAMENYQAAGIRIGKIQVSSAVECCFDDMPIDEKDTVVNILKQFAEDRYLHQTTVWDGNAMQFYEDLPLALEAHRINPCGRWRVHFHVPIFASHLAMLGTTQAEIGECLKYLDRRGEHPVHFEIETYAWPVMPYPWNPKSLAEGIAKELIWFRDDCLPRHTR